MKVEDLLREITIDYKVPQDIETLVDFYHTEPSMSDKFIYYIRRFGFGEILDREISDEADVKKLVKEKYGYYIEGILGAAFASVQYCPQGACDEVHEPLRTYYIHWNSLDVTTTKKMEVWVRKQD